MIHTNNISTEASAGANSISQGKHQGSKANKTLFSTLLGMLQKGASQGSTKQTVQQSSHKNTILSASEGKDKKLSLTNQQGNKNVQHSLNQTSNIDEKIGHILQQTGNTDIAGKKNLTTKKPQATLTQTTNKKEQHNLAQTNQTPTIDKNLQHILAQTKNTQTADKNVQDILTQENQIQNSDTKLQLNLAQTDQSQAKDKGMSTTSTQDTNVDASDAIASLQEAQIMPLVASTHKNSDAIGEQQTNRSTSSTTNQNISPELLAEASSQKHQASQKTESKNTERFTTDMQNAPQNKTFEQPLTIQQGKQQNTTQQSSPITSGAEQTNDGIKTSQAAIAAVQQRNDRQTQQTQTANTSTVTAANSPSAISMAAADNNASSQQDLNSNQHDADMSLLDAAKTDSKSAKGLDFQAQLAYKSQRTFTPADTMLEIVKSAKTGNTSLELQLEPANLGKVQVSIQIDQAKHIQVMFTVDQAASKHALEQQMPQLKLAMTQQGLDLGGFSMQMNQQGGQQQGSNQQTSSNTTTSNGLDTTILTHSNDEQNTRIGVNLAAQGHLSILA